MISEGATGFAQRSENLGPDGSPSAPPKAGWALAEILLANAEAPPRDCSPAMLRAAARFGALLLRRAAMLSSPLTPARARLEDAAPARDLVGSLCDAAVAATDVPLAQLLDWACAAWTGEHYNGCFLMENHLPEPVFADLRAALGRPAPMLRATARRALAERVGQLAETVERLSAIDRNFCRILLVDPVAEVVASLDGAPTDAGLLDHGAEDLVSRANSAMPRRIPQNGRRWPLLVRAAGTVREQVRELLDVHSLLSGGEQPVAAPPLGALDPSLRPLLSAALLLDSDPAQPLTGDGVAELSATAAESLSVLPEPAGRAAFQLAMLAQRFGIAEEASARTLEPFLEIVRGADRWLANLPSGPEENLAELRELLEEAVDLGDIVEAREVAELLESECNRLTLTRRIEALERGVEGLQGADRTRFQRYVDAARERTAAGSFDVAGGFVSDAEALTTRGRAGTEPATYRQGLSVVEITQRLDAISRPSPAQIGQAQRILDHLSPGSGPVDRIQVESELRALVHHDPAPVALDLAERLLDQGEPAFAAVLLEEAERVVPRERRPRCRFLLARALTALGQTERAAAMFEDSSPPVPDSDLKPGEPLPFAADMTPWNIGIHVTGSSPPALLAALQLEATADPEPAALAQAFTRAVESGSRIALGPAIGYAVLAGRPAEALEVYRQYGQEQYINASTCWNIACAYAQSGHLEPATRALRLFAEFTSVRSPACQAVLDRVLGPEAQPVPPPLPVPADRTPAGDVAAAKRLYETGQVAEAVESLEGLLDRDPKNPQAYLLLRIYRDQGRLADAVAVVARLSAVGAATWRHHLELGRNAIAAGDAATARHELAQAGAAGADGVWLDPLMVELHRLEDRAGGTPPVSASTEGAVLARLRAGTSDHEPWQALVGSEVAAGRLDAALELLDSALTTAPWTAGALVVVLSTGEHRPAHLTESQARSLARLVRSSGDEQAGLSLGELLIDYGHHDEALAMLDSVEGRIVPMQLPRQAFLRAKALGRLGRDREAAAEQRRWRVPVLAEAGPRTGVDPSIVPDTHVHRVGGTVASMPLVRTGQEHWDDGDPAAAAEAWAHAAREGVAIVLASTVAAFVAAGRPEDALALYAELADTTWVVAGTAWNLGCAYAAAGYSEAACDCFDYFARIARKTYSDEQLETLRGLFASVGRAVPAVASVSRARASTQDPGGSVLQAVADGELRRDGHSFLLASNALRGAMRAAAGHPAEVQRHLAEIERLFDRLPEPDATAAAELIRAQATGGQPDRAWATALDWIQRTGAAAALLAPAVLVANGHKGMQRTKELRRVLEGHQDGSGFELYLSLAKLAKRQADWLAQRRYARRALDLNPACAEAAYLLTAPNVTKGYRHDSAVESVAKLRTAAPDSAAVAAVLARQYGPLADNLRAEAIRLLSPELDRAGALHELPPAEVSEVERAVKLAPSARKDGNWEEAGVAFLAVLDRRPRHLGLVANTVGCLVRAGRLEAARSVAAPVAYSPVGQDALARIEFAAGDYPAVAEHLARRNALRPYVRQQLLGLVGFVLEYLEQPQQAIRLLMEDAARQLPGKPGLSAGLAVVLADRHGAEAERDGAMRLLLADPLDNPQSVRWAIEHDALEALRDLERPLARTELDALVEHFGGADADRLRRFLGVAGGAGGRWACEALADFEERAGRVASAFRAWWTVLTGSSQDQLAILAQITRFCERNDYHEGYRRALEFKQQQGRQLTQDERDRLAEWADTEAYKVRQLRSDVQAVLWEIQRIEPARIRAEIAEPLARLTDLLDALGQGTSDEPVVGRLSESWTRFIAALGSADPDELTDAPDLARIFTTTRALAEQLGSDLVREAANVVNVRLYGEWEGIARRRHRAEPVEVSVLSAERVAGGPAELLVRLTAREPVDEVRIEAGDQARMVELPAGRPVEVALLGGRDGPEVQVVLTCPALGVEQRQTVAVTTYPVEERRMGTRFNPNGPALGDMFVGRESEREGLRLFYERLPSGDVITVRFLQGPREVGKSSLARSLVAEGPSHTWPIPDVVTVYIDATAIDLTARPFLNYVGTRVVKRLAELRRSGAAIPEVPLPGKLDADAFIEWWADLRNAAERPLGLMVIVDEVQQLLAKLSALGRLESAVEDLRKVQQDGGFGLLLCGSCTLRSVEAWLRNTLLAGEILEEPVGFLGDRETIEVFRRGFEYGVRVLSDAYDEVWRLTAGYPNHIHLIGQQVARMLLDQRRRMVTADLVRDVGYRLGRSDRTVHGIIKQPEQEAPDFIELLLDLADPQTGAVDQGIRGLLTTAQREHLDRYLALGLLRDDDGRLAFANELVLTWLEWQHEMRGKAAVARRLRDRDPAEMPLLDAGYRIRRREVTAGVHTSQVQRDGGERLVARRFEAAPTEAIELLDERFAEYDAGPVLDGFPEYRGRVGDWLIFSYLPGTSLAERLRLHVDVMVEPERAAAWIAGACDVLSRVADQLGVTHGDVRPENVIVSEDAVSVVGWGYGAHSRIGAEPSPLVPEDDGHLSPQYLRRIADDTGGAKPADDVFALGVILYRFLHPEAQRPYQLGLLDADLADQPPAPPSVHADDALDALLGCVRRAIALREEDRFASPREFATALRNAVPRLRDASRLRDRADARVPAGDDPAVPPSVVFNIETLNSEGPIVAKEDQRIKVGGSVSHSVVGHRNRVRDSFNQTQASTAGDEVKEALARLAEQIEAAVADLAPQDADALARDYEAFAGEATSTAPRPGTLARIGEDITSAVSKLAKFATPVLDLVKQVVELFQ